MIYAALRWLMRAITRTYLIGLFHVVGAGNLPRKGPLIICPSHSATLDPPMVPAFTPRADTWNMAKSEYFRGGVGKDDSADVAPRHDHASVAEPPLLLHQRLAHARDRGNSRQGIRVFNVVDSLG